MEIELLCNERRGAVELVYLAPHIDVARTDAFTMQFLGGFHKLLLFVIPDTLYEREPVEPSNDEHDVVLRIGPVNHSSKINLVCGGGKT